MRINDIYYSKKEVLKRVGNIGQIGGARSFEFSEGTARGTKAIDVSLCSGLKYTIIPDRGIDISDAEYRGINLVFKTSSGITHPSFYNPEGMEWLRSFFGGLLTTCGLTYLGMPCNDQGIELGLHGRYSNYPAKKVCDLSHWEENEYYIEISGVVEESFLFSDKLRLTRNIKSAVDSKSLIIGDTIENFGAVSSPFTILYHINVGFPLLDRNAKLIISSAKVEGYDKLSKKDVKDHTVFSDPMANKPEQNFLHTMAADKEGYAYTAIINESLRNGLGLYLKFKADTLPFLNEWKLMSEIDYVVGIEPCNIGCENRCALREKNKLPFLNPGEIRETKIEIGILDGLYEIEAFMNKIKKLK